MFHLHVIEVLTKVNIKRQRLEEKCLKSPVYKPLFISQTEEEHMLPFRKQVPALPSNPFINLSATDKPVIQKTFHCCQCKLGISQSDNYNFVRNKRTIYNNKSPILQFSA